MFPGGLVVRFNPFTAMAQVQSLVEEWRSHKPCSEDKNKRYIHCFFRHNCTLNTDYNIV